MNIAILIEAAWQFATLILIQSTLLIAGAYGAVKLLRVQEAAFLSIVYRSVLLAILVSPLATFVMMHGEVDGWWPSQWNESTFARAEPLESQMLPSTELESHVSAHVDTSVVVATPQNIGPATAEPMPLVPHSEMSPANATAIGGPVVTPTSHGSVNFQTSVLIGKTVFCLAWLTISIGLLLRHYRARRTLRRTLSKAIAVDSTMQTLCDQLADELNVRSPRVVCSPYFTSPFLCGVLHPVIHLSNTACGETNETSKSGLREILIHELAHLKRHDVLMRLSNHVALCLFFFQPLLWQLTKWIENCAEDVCDDYAMSFGARRDRYATRLVDLAEHCDLPLGPAVGIASGKSLLAHRVTRIMDSSRALSTRASRRSLVLCGLVTIAAVVSVGMLLTPANRLTAQTPASPPADDSQSELGQKSVDTDGLSNTRIYSGTVTDADGQAVPNAQLWVSMTHYTAGDPRREPILREVGKTDDQGSFQFAVDDTLRKEMKADLKSRLTLLAQHSKYGIAGLPLAVFRMNAPPSKRRIGLKRGVDKAFGEGYFDQRTIVLPQLCDEVQGQLLDVEGDPLPNVSVNLERVTQPKVEDFLAGLKEKDCNQVQSAERARWIAGTSRATAQLLRQSQPPIKSNAQGKFRLRGLGQDQLATLTFAAERIEALKIYVFGRAMKTERTPHMNSYPDGAQNVYHGTRFTQVLGPAIPVAGIVTEFQSKKPIANALVYVERLFSETDITRADNPLRMDTGHINTVTDAKGRFTLHGIPPGKKHAIRIVPPKSDPWLMAKNYVSPEPNDKELTVDVQVFRGIWIEGKFTDSKTKEPLWGFVDYLALRKNPNTPRAAGLLGDSVMDRFQVDKAGNYRVPGLPGPGVLLARGGAYMQYPLSVGADDVDGYRSNGYLPTTTGGMPVSNWNRIQQIDPPVDANSFTFDLTLTAGDAASGRVVGPNGEKVTGLEIIGLLEKNAFWMPQDADKFSVLNYDAAVGRDLFFTSADKSLVGGFQLKGEPPEDFVVKLQPSVTVTGRLIETEKDEPAVGYSVGCEKSSYGRFRVGDNSNGKVDTDDDGRFEITGLLAGIVYEMYSANVQRFSSGKNDFTIDLTNVQPGAKIELGDVTGKNSNKPDEAKQKADK